VAVPFAASRFVVRLMPHVIPDLFGSQVLATEKKREGIPSAPTTPTIEDTVTLTEKATRGNQGSLRRLVSISIFGEAIHSYVFLLFSLSGGKAENVPLAMST
jgi:hypothetical protein